MKKKFLGFAAIIGLSVALFSCSDDDKNETEYPFSTDTPENIKKYLEAQGETIIKSMEALTDDSAIKVLISFGSISHLIDPSASIDDITSLAEFYGKYTWDAEDGSWTLDSSVKDKAVFIFPKEVGLTSNDAKIEVTATNSGLQTEDEFNIPKDVTLNIYVSDKKVGDMNVSVSNLNVKLLPMQRMQHSI